MEMRSMLIFVVYGLVAATALVAVWCMVELWLSVRPWLRESPDWTQEGGGSHL